MNSNLRHIEKAIEQVKKIKPDNDIEVRYVNQIKRSLLNLQRHIEDDYRKLLEDNPLPDDKGNWKEVEEYKPGQKDSEEYRKHMMDNMTKMFDIPRPDDKGKCDDCEFYTTVTEKGLNDPYCYHYGKYLKDTDGCDAFSKADRKCDEPPDDAICTREIKGKCKDCRHFKRSDNGLDNMCLKHKDHIWEDNGYCDDFQAILGRCERCRHFKSVDAPLVGLCSKHDKSVGNDETCDDFVYKLLSERIADGTVGCKCNTCGRIFQKKDGYVAMKGDKVQSFLCEQCYETAYKRQFGRKEIEDRFKPCPICNGKIMFNTTKDILESQYQHIECSKCGFSWKCSPTLEDEDKLVEYINHSIDVVNDGKPKEVKP